MKYAIETIKFTLVALLLTAGGMAQAAGENMTTIEWEDLMPPPAEGDTLTLNDLNSEDWLGPKVDAPNDGSDVTEMSDPRDPKTQGAHQGNIRPAQQTAPVIKKYDGKRIRLAGYVVPLDFKASKITEFLLVPYVGACIHVPPPPTNQVVFVTTKTPVAVSGLFDPVYVSGTMSLGKSQTALAEAGYRIDATKIVPYE